MGRRRPEGFLFIFCIPGSPLNTTSFAFSGDTRNLPENTVHLAEISDSTALLGALIQTMKKQKSMKSAQLLLLIALTCITSMFNVACSTTVAKVAPTAVAIAQQPGATSAEKAVPKTKVDALTSVNQHFSYRRGHCTDPNCRHSGDCLRLAGYDLNVNRKAPTEGYRDVTEGTGSLTGGTGGLLLGTAAVQGKLGTRVSQNTNVRGVSSVGDVSAVGQGGDANATADADADANANADANAEANVNVGGGGPPHGGGGRH